MFDLTISKIQLFLFVVLPGFVAIRAYEMRAPPEKRDFPTLLLDSVAYSLLNLIAWAWAVKPLNEDNFPLEHPILYAMASAGMLVIFPAVVGYFFYDLRAGWLHSKLKFDHPTRTGWDWFFGRGKHCYILFHLKEKKLLGGYYGEKSFVSAAPQPPEVYVEEVWRVDDRGEFIEKVEGTMGCVIRLADCERVEFLEVEYENA
jgi:hypothetical protein